LNLGRLLSRSLDCVPFKILFSYVKYLKWVYAPTTAQKAIIANLPLALDQISMLLVVSIRIRLG